MRRSIGRVYGGASLLKCSELMVVSGDKTGGGRRKRAIDAITFPQVLFANVVFSLQ